MRSIDLLALIAIAVVAAIGKLGGWYGGSPDGPDLRRPPPRLAPPPRAFPPVGAGAAIEIRLPEKSSSTGTAFSIDRGGGWLTARHVVDGCSHVAIQTGPDRGIGAVRVLAHPSADVAAIWTRGGAPALPLGNGDLRQGQRAFQFGFPGGEAGDVSARLIGRRTLNISGRYRAREPVVAWLQLRRVPDRGPDLAGISGGPVVDRAGGVIGIVVAGAPRRGRTYSAAPMTIAEMLQYAALDPAAAGPGRRIGDADFPAFGRDLRGTLTVAKVLCRVEGRRAARRPAI